MISLKKGVTVRGIRPEMVFGHTIVCAVYASHDLDVIVTSATDGVHSYASKHYDGAAIDYRTRHITATGLKERIVGEAQAALGPDFDVILEDTHLHVQWKPRRRD